MRSQNYKVNKLISSLEVILPDCIYFHAGEKAMEVLRSKNFVRDGKLCGLPLAIGGEIPSSHVKVFFREK